MSTTTLAELPPSVVTWSLASKLALNLVIRERGAPRLEMKPEGTRARWAAALSCAEDAAYVATLGRAMPPAAHAVPVSREAAAGNSSQYITGRTGTFSQ